MPDQTPAIAIVPGILDATEGVETPFGKRWGGEVIRLPADHIAALQAGQTVAVDVQNEYIVFLRSDEAVGLGQANNENLKGLGYGG